MRTPVIGNTASGISEVAGIGIGSKIHQVAQSTVRPAVQQADDCQPFTCNEKKTAAARTGPRKSVTVFLVMASADNRDEKGKIIHACN